MFERSATRETVTIRRVAEVAGVSRATVSRVMNGHQTVDPGMVSRVRAAAEELEYAPSPLARSLALGRTTTIALVVPDLSNPMFQGVLRGLSHAAGIDGHRLLIAESREDVAEEPILALEARRRCDGLVLASPRLPDDQLAALAERLSPLVLLNRELPGSGVPSLSVDHAAGMADIVRHLRSLGHRRLVYLAGPPASVSDAQRRRGLRESAADDIELVELECGSTFAAGHASAEVAVRTAATAIVAYNDLVAYGALSRLHELAVAVPGEVSIVGFDDIPFALYTTPPLTTASVPQHELGEQAWTRLSALLQGRTPEHNVSFRPRLEVRGSTGPAAR